MDENGVTPLMALSETTPATASLPATTTLIEMIRSGADNSQVAARIQSADNINQMDENGVTPLMALVATRSPELVKLALQQGADVGQTVTFKGEQLDSIGFAKAVLGLAIRAKLDYQPGAFHLNGTTGAAQGGLDSGDASRMVENIALIKAKQFEHQQRQSGRIETLQGEYKSWGIKAQQRFEALNQPIAMVAEPNLPPVQSFKKSPFESLAQFQQRMDVAKQQREEQTAKTVAEYRQQVEQRNQRVAKNSRALKALQGEVEAHNSRYQQQLDAAASQLTVEAKGEQQRFIAEAITEVYGAPFVSAIEEQGAPKYDAERGLMFAQLGFSHLAGQQEVVLPVPAGPGAETFYQQLKAGGLQPRATFKFSQGDGNQITLQQVTVDHAGKSYLARLNSSETFVSQKPIEVVLQSSEHAPRLEQGRQEAVVFDEQAINQLAMQNPNIKDVQFEAFLIQEQKAFNDDVPQLLAAAPAAPIDKQKWLFVIGIGQYDQTDDILYSRRSAELFSKVAAKTLGIHPSRQVVLLDKQASSGAIQDQLRLMVDKVKPGDKIYFYYSGHGLPVAEQGNAPYLLPADKIPDFIASDDFYKAQSIYLLLKNSEADQVMAFMDSCFTGTTDGKSIFGGSKAATRLQPKQMQIAKTDKMAILSAGSDKQFSNALPETGHRLFSYYLMKAMLKGYERVGDLATKVRAEVNDKSLDLGGLNRQTPVLVGNPNLVF